MRESNDSDFIDDTLSEGPIGKVYEYAAKSPNGVVIITPTDRIEYANRRFRRLYPENKFTKNQTYSEWCYNLFRKKLLKPDDYDLEEAVRSNWEQRKLPRTTPIIRVYRNGQVMIGRHTTRTDGYQINERRLVPAVGPEARATLPTVKILTSSRHEADIPAMLVNHELYSLDSNSAMIEALKTGQVLVDSMFGVEPANTDFSETLQRAVGSTLARDRGHTFEIYDAQSTRRLVRTHPIYVPTLDGHAMMATLHIMQQSDGRWPERALARFFRLTNAEALCALSFGKGLSKAAIADRARCTPNLVDVALRKVGLQLSARDERELYIGLCQVFRFLDV